MPGRDWGRAEGYSQHRELKKHTVTLVLAASAIYYIILFLALSFLRAGFNPPLYFLAAPLLVLVLILVNDLSSRATVPTKTPKNPPIRTLSRQVQELTKKIRHRTSGG